AMRFEILLKHVDRGTRFAHRLEIIVLVHMEVPSNRAHRAVTAGRTQATPALSAHKSVDCCGVSLVQAGGGASTPDDLVALCAANSAFRRSISSRASTAIAFTASNSSRLTKSRPPIHSLARSRTEASASRPKPASVPAAPFMNLAKSSKSLFSL